MALPFKKVGAMWNTKSRSGKNYISIKFDEDIFDRMYKEDIIKKLCVFPNYKKENNQPDFLIYAPVKEEVDKLKGSSSI